MQESKTLYQKTSSGKIMCWRITRDKNKLTYEWGFNGSPNWQVKWENVNGNRIGTKAELSPDENAKIIFARTINQRLDAGYFFDIKKAIAANIDLIDFDNIPLSLCAPKPRQQKPTKKVLDELIKSKCWVAQRKANGIRAHFVRSPNKAYLFTREWKDCAAQFPDIFKELCCLYIPDNSIIDLEITIDGGYTQTQFQVVSSMAPNTDPKTAAQTYKDWLQKNPRQKLCAVILDIIYLDGIKVLNYTKLDRLMLIDEILKKRSLDQLNANIIRTPEHNSLNFNAIVKTMEDNQWEGLVLWDLNMTSDITLNGKPSRPKGCWKWVNTKKADCFITGIFSEKGNSELVGGFYIGQFVEAGNIIDCGKVASGLTDAEKVDAWNWQDKVIEIEYKSRLKQNKKGQRCFNLPVFNYLRKDKSKSECVAEDV